MSKRISFIVPDIGAPSVGAALRMAQALRGAAEIEIVGPDFGRGVNSMYRADFDFKPISCPRLYRLPDFWWESRRLEKAISGDVVVAIKAFRNTVPVALRAGRRRGAKVAVLLDEWDGAILDGLSTDALRRRRLAQWHHPLEDSHYPAVEARIPEADVVLSTTSFLQRKFGGHVIAMGVDTDKFMPQPGAEVAALKRELGLEGKRLIVFGGVVRPHKGIEIIPEALERLGDDAVRLLVAGPVTEHLDALMRDPRLGRWIHVAGAPMQDPAGLNAAVHKRMAHYLDLADLVVLPLLDTPLAQSQMPIKIFEALAMAKPVIASRVSDLPVLVEGCGLCVPPADRDALAEAIRRVLADDSLRAGWSHAARAKCERQFSLPVVGETLKQLLLG